MSRNHIPLDFYNKKDYNKRNGIKLLYGIAVVDPGAVPGVSTNGDEIGSTREIKVFVDTRL